MKLTPEQDRAAEALYELMTDISEDNYCAGWMSGLEFTLWSFVLGGVRIECWGTDSVEVAQLDALRRLSEECGGWWIWVDYEELGTVRDHRPPEWADDCGPRFLTLAEWEATYERYPGNRT